MSYSPIALNCHLTTQFLRQSPYCNKTFKFDGVKRVPGYHRQIHNLCNELHHLNLDDIVIYEIRQKRNQIYSIETYSKMGNSIPPYLLKKFNLEIRTVCRLCGESMEEIKSDPTFASGNRIVRLTSCWLCRFNEYMMRVESEPKPETLSAENWVKIIGERKGKGKTNE